MSLARRDLGKAERLGAPLASPEGVCFYARKTGEKPTGGNAGGLPRA